MPAKKRFKSSYSHYIVDIPPSHHAETIYIDDDTHSREIHSTVAPPVILPPPILPPQTPQAPRTAASSAPLNRDGESAGAEQNSIEIGDEPVPTDEPDPAENVRAIEKLWDSKVADQRQY